MFTYAPRQLVPSVTVPYFDFWTVVTASAYTYSMTIAGTVSEKLYIDWGDGVTEEYVLIGGSQVVTHEYAIGTFQQKWFVTKTAITVLAAGGQRLVGALPIELQGFTSLTSLQVYANQFNSDLGTNGWPTALYDMSDLEFLYLYTNQFTGDLGLWDISNWSGMRFFLLYGNLFSGDITGWDFADWPLLTYVYMYGLTNVSADVSGWNLSTLSSFVRIRMYSMNLSGYLNIGNETWVSIAQCYMYNNSLTGINNFVNDFFLGRASYTASSKTIIINNNDEYLTGTYQQPDLGTYAGDINDLTETEITNLSNGDDYDGLGSNVIWSTLEKVWVLENLDTTSTSGVKRYGFEFTYDSGVATTQVLNSGALGLLGISDWINPTNGLADNWTKLVPAGLTTAIVTGNGFVGNAQSSINILNLGYDIYSDSFAVDTAKTYIISIRYRSIVNSGSSVIVAKDVFNGTHDIIAFLPENTGDAIVFQSDSFQPAATTLVIGVFAHDEGTSTGNEVQVDEIELIEV